MMDLLVALEDTLNDDNGPCKEKEEEEEVGRFMSAL
jgi:hypothetical protein